jgi:hypothetical protein
MLEYSTTIYQASLHTSIIRSYAEVEGKSSPEHPSPSIENKLWLPENRSGSSEQPGLFFPDYKSFVVK